MRFNMRRLVRTEAELEYGDATFQLRVRDDGVGIDPEVLGRGVRTGHWGLQGVRERAQALGAHFEIWSEDAVGTEVNLTISASVAYARGPAGGRPENG
jgi:signal transduction histidine kinase